MPIACIRSRKSNEIFHVLSQPHCSVWIRFCGKAFTEPLPSNDKGIHVQIQRNYFFPPIYLQSVTIHSSNGVLGSEGG
jgi:hypothetical protein